MTSAPDSRRIVLVRHAETEWSRDGRHTGRTDIPLTDGGRAAARALAPALARLRDALVLCSPLRRARETCELSGLGEGAVLSDELMEWDYGRYEGLTSAQIHAERPEWDLWHDGCPAGESPDQVGARADRAIELLLAAGARPVVVFAHGHILRVLGARWIELAPGEGGRLGLATGALCALGYEHGRRVLDHWNVPVESRRPAAA